MTKTREPNPGNSGVRLSFIIWTFAVSLLAGVVMAVAFDFHFTELAYMQFYFPITAGAYATFIERILATYSEFLCHSRLTLLWYAISIPLAILVSLLFMLAINPSIGCREPGRRRKILKFLFLWPLAALGIIWFFAAQVFQPFYITAGRVPALLDILNMFIAPPLIVGVIVAACGENGMDASRQLNKRTAGILFRSWPGIILRAGLLAAVLSALFMVMGCLIYPVSFGVFKVHGCAYIPHTIALALTFSLEFIIFILSFRMFFNRPSESDPRQIRTALAIAALPVLAAFLFVRIGVFPGWMQKIRRSNELIKILVEANDVPTVEPPGNIGIALCGKEFDEYHENRRIGKGSFYQYKVLKTFEMIYKTKQEYFYNYCRPLDNKSFHSINLRSKSNMDLIRGILTDEKASLTLELDAQLWRILLRSSRFEKDMGALPKTGIECMRNTLNPSNCGDPLFIASSNSPVTPESKAYAAMVMNQIERQKYFYPWITDRLIKHFGFSYSDKLRKRWEEYENERRLWAEEHSGKDPRNEIRPSRIFDGSLSGDLNLILPDSGVNKNVKILLMANTDLGQQDFFCDASISPYFHRIAWFETLDPQGRVEFTNLTDDHVYYLNLVIEDAGEFSSDPEAWEIINPPGIIRLGPDNREVDLGKIEVRYLGPPEAAEE